ncbi:MAG TPA: hypothetical protein DCY13_03680 [Verrucomicrobiales bacterium]|nr:hypothetical protein [Verrucomicrobiales bacterium]
MKYLDLTLRSPAENLAFDEWLLAKCEETGEETLRFWESPARFVVLGISNHVSAEVDLAECGRLEIPVTRRISGGGAVVQGKGCLSYALAMRIPEQGALAAISATNRQVMETNAAAFAKLLGAPVTVRGHTDLEWQGRKFSGNSQKRGRTALLFHGTVLYQADLEQFGRLLRHPSREPDWRQQRTHERFLVNIPLSRPQLMAALRQAWRAEEEHAQTFATKVVEALAQRHRDPKWVHRLP